MPDEIFSRSPSWVCSTRSPLFLDLRPIPEVFTAGLLLLKELYKTVGLIKLGPSSRLTLDIETFCWDWDLGMLRFGF